ncbi:xanthine dehydrogenase family protein molybdopterin-binding subunit [Flavihumibacter fluvii]|uniref:xanthine dehydrogenase family protein molybdopterin-binding subunit n=1 Tax=Flavihumibacter fluvii TaxID=2838157 RepID=UPI001BDE4612|nr:molybdopterin cofactor-binding domain-containing protein [Flavihumibacter fluvii]ULQ54724.1 molybdopterin-dependent oxidoreductase [Flavihumibacter fluvii]
MNTKLHRRHFIKLSSAAGGSLILGMMLPMACKTGTKVEVAACDPLQPMPYLKIESTGDITIYFARAEMGQGVNTSLPMILAEELDADWAKVKTDLLPYGVTIERADKPAFGGYYTTGGSQSVLTDWNEMRRVGATAKAMLVSAAAKKWNIAESDCSTANSVVTNTKSKETLTYAELVCDAIKLPVPKDVKLKEAKDFTLIGKPAPRKNLGNMITGKTKYGIDVKVDGMVYAVVERCPVLQGKVKSFDDSACKNISGYLKAIQFDGAGAPMHIHSGVAILATSIWSAMKARKLLKVEWDEAGHGNESTDELFKTFESRSKNKPAIEVFKKGDPAKVKATAVNTLESAFAAPFLAHGTMEPINVIAQVQNGKAEFWCGNQFPEFAPPTLATELGIDPKNIQINLAYIGGGFGRRLFFDYMLEAAKIARQYDKPVKVIWDRVDDIRNDAFRPANYHRMKASWDDTGKLLSWQHHYVGSSINLMLEGPDAKVIGDMNGGATADFWYDIPNVKTGFTHVDFNLQRGWLRAVEININVFPVESFIDELAVKLKKDPVQFRLDLLSTMPKRMTEYPFQDPQRIAGVLKLVADKIGYAQPLQPNHYIGVATHHFSFCPTYVAHAIEIEMLAPKKFRIVKVVAAVDCGIVVNPDGLLNQMQGALAFALTQALKGEITIKNGRVEQDSFFNYELLRYPEMPPIDVHVVQSAEPCGGIGEVGMPTVAPALCNALAAAGQRPYRLPLKKDGYEWV